MLKSSITNLVHVRLKVINVSGKHECEGVAWLWTTLTTLVGFIRQSARELGHGQGRVRVDDHEGREHPRHSRAHQHHPRRAGTPGVPADRQNRYRAGIQSVVILCGHVCARGVCVCVCPSTCVSMCVYRYVCVSTYVQNVCIHICAWACALTYVHRACVSTCAHTVCVYMYARDVCVHVCSGAHMLVCVCVAGY